MDSIIRKTVDAVKNGWKLFYNLKNHGGHMQNLRSKIEELSGREYDVLVKVEKEETEQGKKRKREVDVWLENVKRIKTEVNSIEVEVREEKNWVSLYRLTMLIRNKVMEVVELKEKGGFTDGVTVEPLLGTGSPQPSETLLGESANKTLKKIWDCLMDVEVGKVGVHGMAGVGKTTIMKHIHNQLLETHFFKCYLGDSL